MISFRLRPDCWATFLLERQKHLCQHRFIANWLVLRCEICYGSNRGWLNGWKKVHDTSYWRKSYKLLRVGKKFMSVRGKFIKCLRVGGCLTRLLWRDFLQLLFFSWHHKFPTSSCMSDFVLDKGGRDAEKNRKIIHNNLKAAVDFCRLSIGTRRQWSSFNWTNNVHYERESFSGRCARQNIRGMINIISIKNYLLQKFWRLRGKILNVCG